MASPDQAPDSSGHGPVSARDVKAAWLHGMDGLARREAELADAVEVTTGGPRRETFHIPSAGGITQFSGLEGAVGKAAATALRQPHETQ